MDQLHNNELENNESSETRKIQTVYYSCILKILHIYAYVTDSKRSLERSGEETRNIRDSRRKSIGTILVSMRGRGRASNRDRSAIFVRTRNCTARWRSTINPTRCVA